ncbi:MAG: hypothetical protein M1299_08935 [Firmicutes bacterium]|nr:hypothetical protein [Bacillota bacterium]MCL5039930.1 hypothetical protein [Bacillota bacterium]
MFKSLLIGLAVGSGAGYVNHRLLRGALVRAQGLQGRKAQNAVIGGVMLRMLLDFSVLLALFLLYPHDAFLLLAATLTMIAFIFYSIRLTWPQGRGGLR